MTLFGLANAAAALPISLWISHQLLCYCHRTWISTPLCSFSPEFGSLQDSVFRFGEVFVLVCFFCVFLFIFYFYQFVTSIHVNVIYFICFLEQCVILESNRFIFCIFSLWPCLNGLFFALKSQLQGHSNWLLSLSCLLYVLHLSIIILIVIKQKPN